MNFRPRVGDIVSYDGNVGKISHISLDASKCEQITVPFDNGLLGYFYNGNLNNKSRYSSYATEASKLTLVKRPVNYKLNRKKDKRDHRDKLYRAQMTPLELPKQVDLFPNVPMILNQGELSSCTAHGLAGCFQYLEAMDLKKQDFNEAEVFSKTFTPISRMMIYSGERIIENDLNADDGAQIRDGIKFLARTGVCEESLFPYTQENLHKAPPPEAIEAAKNHKITEYFRLTTLDEMKHCLASGFPFVFGSYLYESFMSDEVAKTGIVPDPKEGEKEEGGHALYCVGYDNDTQRFTVVNSWGQEFGDKGRCYMSYNYISNPNLTDDIWTIRK